MERGAKLFLCGSLAVLMVGCVTGPSADSRTPPPEVVCRPPCKVVIDHGTRWEPAVAINPREPNNIVAVSMNQGLDQAGARYSLPLAHASADGGLSWTTASLPMGAAAGGQHPLAGYNHADDPTATFLADGTLVVAALTFTYVAAQGRAVFIAPAAISLWRSNDGGRSFPDAQVAFAGKGNVFPGSPDGYTENDKQWLAPDSDGGLLMAWNQNTRGTPACPQECTRLIVSWSQDKGRSWSEPLVVHSGISSGAFPLVLDDGRWVVSYRDTERATIHVAASRDQGATWTTNDSIDFTTKFPVLAKVGDGERIYMAYPRAAEKRGQPEVPQVVAIRWSDDGGDTWSLATDIATSSAPARTSPALATIGDTAIVTFWHPQESNGELGATLTAVAVASRGSASHRLILDSHEGTTRTTGDYMGLASFGEGNAAYAVWNARHGNAHHITGARLSLGASGSIIAG